MKPSPLRRWLDPLLDLHDEFRVALEGKTILVTGVSGFVGSWLTAALLRFAETGTHLRLVGVARNPGRVVERLGPMLDCAPLELIAADLTTPSVSLPRADFVIHAAGEVSTGVFPEELVRGIVAASDAVASHSASTGAERFLFVSSGAVYGPQPVSLHRVAETYGGAPDSCGPDVYGNAKRWGETLSLVRGRAAGVSVGIARCFSFAGAFLPLDRRFALGNFVQDALAGGPVRVRGSGTPLRSYLDGADMALWLLAALLRGKDGHCYNIGSPIPMSIAEVAGSVARCFGCSVIVEGGIDGALRYVPSVERARRELGVAQTVSLDESVRRMDECCKEGEK